MHDNISRDGIPFDSSNVVIPQGWRVISHGTNFKKWNVPIAGRPAQDLKTCDRVIVCDTVDGGLACVSEKESGLPLVYAGKDEPVVFRVFVPEYGPSFNVRDIEDGLRFLKPQSLNKNIALVPVDTTLVKVGENIAAAGKDTPVIWYVPEQFLPLLMRDLESLRLKQERVKDISDDANAGVPGFDINDSFAVAENLDEDEHLIEQEEKADEYYEDLDEQQQALVDAEVEAEEELAAKRKKDKDKARAQDKKNFAAAQAEHEKQMAEANERRGHSEQPTSEYAYDNSQGNSYEYASEPASPVSEQPFEEPYQYSQESVVSSREESETEASASYGSEQNGYADKTVLSDSVGSEGNVSGYEQIEDRSVPSEIEIRKRREADAEYVAEQERRAEETRRFHDEMQSEALRRQERSENYKSFGSSGIDFSGHDEHSAYSEQGSHGYGMPQNIPLYSDSEATPNSPHSISADEYKRYEDNFYAAREHFRSYSDKVPESVAQEYKEASDRYYSVQRKIDEGSVVVDKSLSFDKRSSISEVPGAAVSGAVDEVRYSPQQHPNNQYAPSYSPNPHHDRYSHDNVPKPLHTENDYDSLKSEKAVIHSEGASQKISSSGTEATPSSPQFISADEYKRYEDRVYAAREHFRSYTDKVPESVAQEYKEASDRYYSVRRKIDEGSIVVEKPRDLDKPSHVGTGEDRSVRSHSDSQQDFSLSSANLKGDHRPEHFNNKSVDYKVQSGYKPSEKSKGVYPSDNASNNKAQASTNDVKLADSKERAYAKHPIEHKNASSERADKSSKPSGSIGKTDDVSVHKHSEGHSGTSGVVSSHGGIHSNVGGRQSIAGSHNSAHQGGVVNPSNSHMPSRPNHSGISNPPGGGSGVKVPRVTVQNTQTGDAPTPRSAASLKNPPKSPVDLSPLTFSPERFRAIRRFANDASNANVSALRMVKHQVIRAASSDDSGAGRYMSSSSRSLSDAVVVMDALTKGSGKVDAAKVWSKHIAEEKGQKRRGVDKGAVSDFGKIDVKNVNKKIKETLTDADLKKLHKKFGKEADVGVHVAVGTKNGRIGKRNVFINGKVDVSIAEGKIGALRKQSSNLKAEIRVLQAKGSALTGVERAKYADLIKKKKATDEKLKKMVGATNSRHSTERLYRQINAMSPKKLDKEIKILEERIKNGFKLNKVQKRQFKAMKERQALFKMHEKLAGRGLGRRVGMAAGVGGRQVGKLLRKSGDETFGSMMSVADGIQSAGRFATNRYVRGAIKWSVKTAMLPSKLALRLAKKADRALGVSAAVKKQASKTAHDVSSRLLHSKPATKIKSTQKRVVGRVKSAYQKGRLKKAVDSGVRAASKTKRAAQAVLNVFNRLNNTKVVKGVKAVLRAPFKGLKLANAAVTAVKKVILKYIIVPVAWLLIAAFLASTITTLLVNIPSSVFCADEEADGKIDLSSYIKILNKEQKNINTTVTNHKNNTEANGGKYKKVYVNYLGGANNNNSKEILSMTAVYFNQDFSNREAVDDYLVQLFNASNYVTTSESDVYYCSGCEKREYHCYDTPDKYATDKRISLYNSSDHSDEPFVGEDKSVQKGCVRSAPYSCTEKGHGTYNSKGCVIHNGGMPSSSLGGCDNYKTDSYYDMSGGTIDIYTCKGHCYTKHYDYSCPGHEETICKGHIDLYVNVVCLGFDKIFSADPGVTVGKELGDYKQGDLIGTFNITYYCAEKYPHICNAGPPYKTASGTSVTAGRTIAVDDDVIPLGTAVVINGHTYIAEDTGGAISGNRIDIAVATHQEALSLGTDVFKVYKAVEKTDEEAAEKEVDRYTVPYLDYAKEAAADSDGKFLSYTFALQAFGQAKEPEIIWKHDRVNYDDEHSFTEKLLKYDEEHNNEEFTNAELNVLEYVKMSKKELVALAKERKNKDYSSSSFYDIIVNVLIPYDKEHPDVYVVSPDDEEKQDELYFEGWNKDNKEWAKSIHKNMTSDVYAGLEDIASGSGGNHISLEGITIQGNKIDVKYYSQHDPRWAKTPVRSDYPQHTISAAGCGPSSMAIVVSSLTSNTIDPAGMCAKYGKVYYKPGAGSYWSIVAGISADYGLSCKELSTGNVQGVINALNEGKLVVALVGSGGVGYTGSGYYKGGGHFLVICGVTDDGKFLMADPNEPAISTSGQGVDMQHFLDSGIKSWWVIGR